MNKKTRSKRMSKSSRLVTCWMIFSVMCGVGVCGEKQPPSVPAQANQNVSSKQHPPKQHAPKQHAPKHHAAKQPSSKKHPPKPRPISVHQLLIHPDVLLKNRIKIGLSDEDVQFIQECTKKDLAAKKELQTQMNEAMAKLVEELSKQTVDESTTLKRLDEVLTLEKKIKHIHLCLMVKLRNRLTVEQRKIATKLNERGNSTDEIKQRLHEKITKIEKEIQVRFKSDSPPKYIVGLMQKFTELVKNGQLRDADALLEKVISAMESDERNFRARFDQKIAQFQKRIQMLKQGRRDVTELMKVMEQIRVLRKEGEFEKADKLVDKGLEMTRFQK